MGLTQAAVRGLIHAAAAVVGALPAAAAALHLVENTSVQGSTHVFVQAGVACEVSS
jgi:hypothetical protein